MKSLDPTVLTPTGAVKVLPTLRVPLANGSTNVFALGDIIDTTQQKTISKVPAQAEVVAANILAATKGGLGAKQYNGYMGGCLQRVPQSLLSADTHALVSEVMLVTLGPTGGRSWLPILWGLILGDFMTRMLKSKTLFVYPARDRLVAPKPSIFARLFKLFS